MYQYVSIFAELKSDFYRHPQFFTQPTNRFGTSGHPKPVSGFFLQPATGFGERSFDEASWSGLLKLSQYPQAPRYHPNCCGCNGPTAMVYHFLGKWTSVFPEMNIRLEKEVCCFFSGYQEAFCLSCVNCSHVLLMNLVHDTYLYYSMYLMYIYIYVYIYMYIYIYIHLSFHIFIHLFFIYLVIHLFIY